MKRTIKPGFEDRVKILSERVTEYEGWIIMEEGPCTARRLMDDLETIKDQLSLCYDRPDEDEWIMSRMGRV